MSIVKEYIRHLHTVHLNSLTESSPSVEGPEGTLKLPLHLHQKMVLKKMEELEYTLTNGMDLKN
jgi:hypothetical protein